MQVNLDDFIPATEEEKEYMVQMRPSTTAFKDGIRRLKKNKVAMVSFFIILIITLSAIFVPMFWPYKYETMLGMQPGQPVDASFNNLKPFEYAYSFLSRSAFELFFKLYRKLFEIDAFKELLYSLGTHHSLKIVLIFFLHVPVFLFTQALLE